jgi:NADH-quinone oxidoreductase subunit J
MTITPVIIIFGVLAVCALGGGFGVVTSRNLVHSALYLITSLFGVGGLFLMLEAPFLAAVQILVYVGAISVLITITVMVTRRVGVTGSVNSQWPLAALVSVLILATLGFIILNVFGNATLAAVPADTVAQLGAALVDHQGYLLPFEVASVLLLAALIGAIVVAREN